MAFEEVLQSFTMEAGADLSGHQYRFVKVTGDKTVGPCDTAGELAVGVNQGDVSNVGEAVQVGFHGISKVSASAAIAAGALVATTTGGQAVTAAGAGTEAIGMALKAASAEGELIPVLLGHFGTLSA